MFSDIIKSEFPDVGRMGTQCKALDYLELLNKDYYLIVETGSMRIFGNWLEGNSTRIWDRFVNFKDGMVVSIDISSACATLISQTCSEKVKSITSDSIEFLWGYRPSQPIDLLYLDTVDPWPHTPITAGTVLGELGASSLPQDPPWKCHLSPLHHFMEFVAILPALQDGCLVMVDDTNNLEYGKGSFIRRFFDSVGIEPLFSEYQIAWIYRRK